MEGEESPSPSPFVTLAGICEDARSLGVEGGEDGGLLGVSVEVIGAFVDS